MAQDLTTLLDALPRDVLSALGELDFKVGHQRANEDVGALLNTTVLEGGKRLRPMLTLLAGKLIGAQIAEVRILARAIEQVHAASLAHDDVIDLATTRRGAPSINREGGNKRAVLAGDYLLAEVIVGLAKLERPEIVKEMASVIQDLAYGEWIQWDVVRDRAPTAELLDEIAKKKTASVMSWCFVSPWVLNHESRELVELGRKLGLHLGIAFQLMDDTLDELATSAKDGQLDLLNDQLNAVVFEWMNDHPKAMSEFKSGTSLMEILDGADLTAARGRVEKRAVDHINQCRGLLGQVKSQKSGLDEQSLMALECIFTFLEQRKF